MTTPQFDITEVIPSKAKAWVGLLGSLLTLFGPVILETTDALPAPWPVVIGGVFAVLTFLGIYKAPYKPQGTALVPEAAIAPDTNEVASPPAQLPNPAPWQNPWKG